MSTYNGKVVFTLETFDYANAKVSDYVEQAVVDEAINCHPPACMTSVCTQMGEPYSFKQDERTKAWRSTYATFKRVTSGQDGIWEYCGNCFCGENVERGTPPYYV